MSVAQVLETVKSFSSAEILELIDALQEKHLKSLEDYHAKRLAEVEVFMNEPIILPEGTPTLREMFEAGGR
jgi:hypothetical protein